MICNLGEREEAAKEFMSNRRMALSYSDKNSNGYYGDLWEKLKMNGITQKQNEITELWQLFDKLQPRVIVEVGVSQGGTFAGWCQLASDDALIIGIDRETNDCWPRYGNQVHLDIANPCEKMTEAGGGMYALKRKGSNQRIVPIKGWTYEPITFGKLLGALNGEKIDFLFHDASHDCEMTKKDFELFWPLIADGGVMAFHDVGYCSAPEVSKWKWWREIRDNGPQIISYSYQFNDRMDQSMGIGVLFK